VRKAVIGMEELKVKRKIKKLMENLKEKLYYIQKKKINI